MSQRYRSRYLEAGDNLEPRDWNYNMAELAGEWNGYLDSHNLPVNALVEGRFVSRAFANLRGSSSTTTLTTVGLAIGWQADDGAASPVTLGSTTFTSDFDCALMCEFGADFLWDAAAWTGTGNRGSDVVAVRFRIVVDGFAVAESGFLEEGLVRNNVYICGVGIVQAGPHTVRAEYQKIFMHNHVADSGSSKGLTIGSRELIVHERYR